MQWSEKYVIGVKRVDLQHKKLILMIDELGASLSEGITGQPLANALRFLVDYTKYHFHDEEEVMRSINFSEIEPHMLRHKEFIDKVTAIFQGMKKGEMCNHMELMKFLVKWILNHILKEDIRIGRELRTRLDMEQQVEKSQLLTTGC